jgi:hypothetical protein
LSLQIRIAEQLEDKKPGKFAEGGSIRGHGGSQSIGVLSRASVQWDFISYGYKQFWNPKTEGHNKFMSF